MSCMWCATMKLPVNEIICGDCLEVMKDWPDNCVDLVLTDPPYGIKRFERGSLRFDKKNEYADGLKWDKKPAKSLLDKVLLMGTEHIIWGMNNLKLPTSEYYYVWNIKQTVDNFASAELAWTDIKMPAKVFHYSIHQHNQTDKYHPTQKPLPLMLWCLSYSKTTGIILDPFCGSGTTCVAAKMLGRNYIGIDISEEYCEIARQRIKAVETGVPVKEQRKGQMGLFK